MNKRNFLKLFIFISILIFWGRMVSNILCDSAGTSWATQTGMENVHKYENYFDVMFLGTSTVISNISNQELYERYGIAGVSIGEPEQLVYLTKYTLEEALIHQKPKVVFFDSKAMFYSDNDIREKTLEHKENIHNMVNSLKTLRVKREALEAIKTYDSEIDIWEYYSKLYYRHKNWESVGKKNFTGYNARDCMNGNIAVSNCYENINYDYEASLSDSAAIRISEYNEKIFAEMVQMCQNAGVDLVVITGYLSTKTQHDEMAKLTQKYDVEFIDINEDFSTVGLDINIDLHDGVHFNINGAIKWTDYLGSYLEEHYEFLDKRVDDRYAYFEKQRSVFDIQKKFMATKTELLSAITFDNYLEKLQNVDRKKNLIFISIYDDASAALTDKEIELLEKLGLQKADLRGYWRASYAAAILNEGIIEEFSETEAVEIVGSEDDVLFKLGSGGYANIEKASIVINDREYMQKGRGINVVVFNKDLRQVASSIYFDTSAMPNPHAEKILVSQTEQRKIEVGKNIWEVIK